MTLDKQDYKYALNLYTTTRALHGRQEMKGNITNWMLALLIVLVVALAGCPGGDGGSGSVTPVAEVATEVWVGSNGQGNTNISLAKHADGTITTTGQWTYNYQGSTVTCQISAGNMTIAGANVTLTATGTATNTAAPAGFQTSPFTLTQTGTMSAGQGSGTFEIRFQTTGWPAPISGNWTAQRLSGSNVTDTPIVPTTVPSAPLGVTAIPGNGEVTISWSAVSGATSYDIFWSTIPGVSRGAGAQLSVTSPYLLTGLTSGTTYYFFVTARNIAGSSNDSSVALATPQALVVAPSAPTDVTATASNGQVSIQWSDVVGATSYNIYWGTTLGITRDNGIKITGVTSPYTHSGLINGVTTYYLVTTANSSGESNASLVVSATPLGGTEPKFASDTCNTPTAQGCLTGVYSYTNGRISGITNYFYVKNIGGNGNINITVSAGGYTENKQFAVDAGVRYTIKSIVPVYSTSGVSSDRLYVTLSSPGFSKTNTISASYSPTFPAGYYRYVANGTPSSSLVVE